MRIADGVPAPPHKATALATMILIAPVSFHRIVFRRGQKAALVVAADRLLMLGLAHLIPAICSAVLLILDVVLGLWQAILGSALTAAVGLGTWYVLPLVIRRSRPDLPAEPRRRRYRPGRSRPATPVG
jgi:hypothetical protein